MKIFASVELIEYETQDEGPPGQKGRLNIQLAPDRTARDLDDLTQLLGQARAGQQPSTYDGDLIDVVCMAG
ncbi:hypothetical protein [Variovorax sp. J22R115]|uniref:hypothetical protein n=1 Tax=Variovorax sp. J22R115 TaxID=3053509 RepID=UPI0025763833|nr:hypothetical protein [Variovorax sp. J22R115]MDM0047826.1 hypothetical protein [Variovorax sp. J22R115]